MRTVYVSIGNSDDKLTQQEWYAFANSVDSRLRVAADPMHGAWYSLANAPWQNACWAFDIAERDIVPMQAELSRMAGHWRQDSIAWAEATTTFLEGTLEARQQRAAVR